MAHTQSCGETGLGRQWQREDIEPEDEEDEEAPPRWYNPDTGEIYPEDGRLSYRGRPEPLGADQTPWQWQRQRAEMDVEVDHEDLMRQVFRLYYVAQGIEGDGWKDDVRRSMSQLLQTVDDVLRTAKYVFRGATDAQHDVLQPSTKAMIADSSYEVLHWAAFVPYGLAMWDPETVRSVSEVQSPAVDKPSKGASVEDRLCALEVSLYSKPSEGPILSRIAVLEAECDIDSTAMQDTNLDDRLVAVERILL